MHPSCWGKLPKDQDFGVVEGFATASLLLDGGGAELVEGSEADGAGALSPAEALSPEAESLDDLSPLTPASPESDGAAGAGAPVLV